MNDPLDERLATLDRDQLADLVRRLVDREPSLVDLILVPLPSERRPVEPQPLAAQVTEILLTMGDDWRASLRAERELTPLVALGTQFLDAGAVEDARMVWRTILHTILRHYLRIRDEESEIVGVVNECVKCLAACLDRTADPSVRAAILGDVFAVFRWDQLDHGGYGMDEPAATVLVERATPDERVLLAAQVRQALPSGAHRHDRWGRQAGGRLIVRLVGADLDAAAREQILADADLDGERLDLLVHAGRIDEAECLVRDAPGEDVVDLADRLIRLGQPDAARSAVRNHPGMLSTSNHRLRDWMVRHDLPLPPHLDELLRAISRFEVRPDIGSYSALREAARASSQWPRVLDHLAPLDPERTKYQPLRARIAADRGDVPRARAELEVMKGGSWKSASSRWRGAVEDVARSLEAHDARAAVSLYQELLDDLLAHGTGPARKRADEVGARIAAVRASASRR